MNQETSLTSALYLAKLNDDQRRAVEHGVTGRGANIAPPLQVIAGAGSGKTNTLAHRVAHLVVHGADPARILLLTFSRRAAAEMETRATHRRHCAWQHARIGEHRAAVGGNLSWHRCPHPAPLRSRHRAGVRLHRPRPRRLRRAHGLGAP